MIFINIIQKNKKMGSGESVYVKNQEEFVRSNRNSFKSQLPGYSSSQIDGKLRQLYAGTDTRKENSWAYINPSKWNDAKTKVIVLYPSTKTRY